MTLPMVQQKLLDELDAQGVTGWARDQVATAKPPHWVFRPGYKSRLVETADEFVVAYRRGWRRA